MIVDEMISKFGYELFVTFFVLVLAYCVFTRIRHQAKNLPPGPMGLPIVGYLPFLTKKPHLKFQELQKKYGKVFSVRLGSQYIVVLNNASVIKEAYSKPEFLGRPPNSPFKFVKSFHGITVMNGKEWAEHRRYSLQSLKDLGLGKSRMEEYIMEEIRNFIQVIEGYEGEPCNVKEPLTPSMSNNICALVFGKRYEYDDPRRKMLDHIIEEIVQCLGQTSVYVFFPWAKFTFLRFLFGYNNLCKAIDTILEFIRGEVEEHKRTFDPDNIRDFIDGYLLEMEARKGKDPNTYFTENSLRGTVQSFFGAGSETVRTTIGWCLYIMASYPDVQKKVQDEIADVIGKERMPMWLDQKAMPYTHSVLMEIQRWKTVAPLSLLRYTLDDSTVSGYHIPKDTIVMANLWAAHHDPADWNDPEEFIPDRFLSKDGKSVEKSDSYMPFSTGKRGCPGEILAVVEVFLYFTSILQRFEIRLPKGTKPDFDGIVGLTYQLKPYKLRLIPRY